MEQFAYVATHDLRSPILNLRSLTELFAKRNSDLLENDPIFERLQKAVNRIDDTLHDLIAVAAHRKTLDESNTEVNLNFVLDDLKEDLALQINHSNDKIECDFEKLTSFIYPKGHVRSILQNLISNSLKYSSSNRKPEVKISSMKEDEFVRISVADNGKGIPPEKIDYIFGLFKRLDKDDNGKGMGLYIVKSQLESLGGKIEVDTNQTQGVRFNVYLKEQMNSNL